MALTREKLKQLKKVSDKLKKVKINSSSFHKKFAEETRLNKKETIFTSGNVYKTRDGKPIRGEIEPWIKIPWTGPPLHGPFETKPPIFTHPLHLKKPWKPGKGKEPWKPSIKPSKPSGKGTGKTLQVVGIKEKLTQSDKKRSWRWTGVSLSDPPTDSGGAGGPH